MKNFTILVALLLGGCPTPSEEEGPTTAREEPTPERAPEPKADYLFEFTTEPRGGLGLQAEEERGPCVQGWALVPSLGQLKSGTGHGSSEKPPKVKPEGTAEGRCDSET